MTTVKVLSEGAEAPSQAIVNAAAAAGETVTDELGRTLVVRRVNAVQLYRLTRILGDVPQGTLNLAMSAASVMSIDGDQIGFPASNREIEATLQRLDYAGLNAVRKVLAPSEEDAPGSDLEAAKN
jgi:hypothetical protein